MPTRVPPSCRPEVAALRAYLAAGGSALLMLDLGFVPEAGLARLLSDLGARLEQEVVVDPLSHYQRDAEMVAVTGYDPHPITRTLSLTFFPGVRPLTLTQPAPGVEVMPILQSSRDSYARPVSPADERAVEVSSAPAAQVATQVADVRPRVLGMAAEGTLAPGASPFRAVVIGDGDFASNSFLPYMSNSDLLGWRRRAACPRGAGHRRPHQDPRAADGPADGGAEPLALHPDRHRAAADGGRGRRRGLVVEAMSALSLRAWPCRCSR